MFVFLTNFQPMFFFSTLWKLTFKFWNHLSKGYDYCRFKNLTICSHPSKNHTLKSFVFLIIINLELFTAKFAFFLKNTLIFNIFCCFRMFVNKIFTYLGRAYLRKQEVLYNAIPSVHYFYINSKILADFQICISVSLILHVFSNNCCKWSEQNKLM